MLPDSMDEREPARQELVHGALADLLGLDDGEVLTGWIVVYETVSAENVPVAGHMYGPDGMTTWRAMGLVEWARSRTLPEACSEDDEE